MTYKDIGVDIAGYVATIEIRRPPHNFFDVALINEIADALDALDADDACRAVVLAAQGKSFCAGANFGDGSTLDAAGKRPGEAMAPIAHLYTHAARLFSAKKPIVAAIQGAAVGAGLGLALVAKLVAGHGGVVDFESGPGRTVFRVLLPAAHALEGVS